MVKTNKRVLQFFSSLADETRLKIVVCLSEKSRNVGNIHKIVGKKKITLPAISHQLKLLENSGVVVFKKIGREKIFSLADGFCWCIVKDVFGHFDKGEKCKCNECCSVKSGRGNK